MPLLRFKPGPNRPIMVSVDKSLLTIEETNKGELINVDNIYGFEINIQNVGNHLIDKCTIEINLDKDAKIIEFDVQPPSKPGRIITTKRDEYMLNVLRVVPEYINKKEKLQIRIISTGNVSKKCELDILGPGIQAQERSSCKILFTSLLLIIGSAILLICLTPKNYFGRQIINILGLRVKQEEVIDWPWWMFLLFLLFALLCYYLMFKEAWKNQRKRRKRW